MEELEKITAEFEKAIGEDLHKKWLVQADYFLKQYFRREENPFTPEDIVGEIIIKTIDEGGRNWDINKVALNAYMYNSIRSEVSNISERVSKYENVDFNDQEYASRTTEIYNRHFVSLTEIENANDYREMYNKCLKILAEDTDCCLVFMELREGKSEKEIAESLGFTVKADTCY